MKLLAFFLLSFAIHASDYCPDLHCYKSKYECSLDQVRAHYKDIVDLCGADKIASLPELTLNREMEDDKYEEFCMWPDYYPPSIEELRSHKIVRGTDSTGVIFISYLSPLEDEPRVITLFLLKNEWRIIEGTPSKDAKDPEYCFGHEKVPYATLEQLKALASFIENQTKF